MNTDFIPDEADALSPQQLQAFAVVCEHARDFGTVTDFAPVSHEQTQAKQFFSAFSSAPDMLNDVVFLGWLNCRDKLCRLSLLRLKAGDHAPDTLILVKPSTDLRKPFSTVLQANQVMDAILGLLGLAREHLLRPETAPGIPEELFAQHDLEIQLLFLRFRDLMGMDSPQSN
jgi:hypothetical protein